MVRMYDLEPNMRYGRATRITSSPVSKRVTVMQNACGYIRVGDPADVLFKFKMLRHFQNFVYAPVLLEIGDGYELGVTTG